MIKFRLYIPPVILGFVIVPLLVWPTVIVLAVLIFTLTFLAEIIFILLSAPGCAYFSSGITT